MRMAGSFWSFLRFGKVLNVYLVHQVGVVYSSLEGEGGLVPARRVSELFQCGWLYGGLRTHVRQCG